MKWMKVIHDHEREHWRSSQPWLLFHLILTCWKRDVYVLFSNTQLHFLLHEETLVLLCFDPHWVKNINFLQSVTKSWGIHVFARNKNSWTEWKIRRRFLTATTITKKKVRGGMEVVFGEEGSMIVNMFSLKHVHLYFISTDWAFALYNFSAQMMTELKERKQTWTFHSSSKKNNFQQMDYFRKRKKHRDRHTDFSLGRLHLRRWNLTPSAPLLLPTHLQYGLQSQLRIGNFYFDSSDNNSSVCCWFQRQTVRDTKLEAKATQCPREKP